jgi:hypothetical protein
MTFFEDSALRDKIEKPDLGAFLGVVEIAGD